MTPRPAFFIAVSSLAAILILAAGCTEQTPTAVRLEELFTDFIGGESDTESQPTVSLSNRDDADLPRNT